MASAPSKPVPDEINQREQRNAAQRLDQEPREIAQRQKRTSAGKSAKTNPVIVLKTSAAPVIPSVINQPSNKVTRYFHTPAQSRCKLARLNHTIAISTSSAKSPFSTRATVGGDTSPLAPPGASTKSRHVSITL